MTDPGRPTLYRSDYCELARNYCLLGATNADLAGFFGVTTRTIDNWIATHPEFATAVREARAVADARVARCLYERAVGYEHTVERTVWHLGKERPSVTRCAIRPIPGPASSGCAIASPDSGAGAPRRRRPIRSTTSPCSMLPVSGRAKHVHEMFQALITVFAPDARQPKVAV